MSQFHISNLRNRTKFDGTYFQVWKHNLKLVLKLEKLLKLIVEGKEVLSSTTRATPGNRITHT